jgi:hypothetical protein
MPDKTMTSKDAAAAAMATDTVKRIEEAVTKPLYTAINDHVAPDVQSLVEEELGTIPEPRRNVAPRGLQIVERAVAKPVEDAIGEAAVAAVAEKPGAPSH